MSLGDSIIACIPCFNAANTLQRSCESVLAQSVPIRELIVVDDGSTDGSAEIARLAAHRVIRLNRNSGRGTARQRAIESADADYILFADATLALEPTFLQRALTHFASERVAAVFGLVGDSNPRSFLDRWRERHLFKTAAKRGVERNASLMTGGVLLKRSAVLAVGGFDTRLRAGEDQELGERLLRAGYEVVCDSALALRPLTSDRLIQLLARYSRWNCAPGAAPTWREYRSLVKYHFGVLRQDLSAWDLPCAFLTIVVPHFMFWSRWIVARRTRETRELPGRTSVAKAA